MPDIFDYSLEKQLPYDNFDHHCVIIRPHDQLQLHFYFVNLKVKKSGLKEYLKKKNPNHFAYMVVQLPQQHIAEELVEDDASESDQKKSFTAGYSFLSFQIPQSFFDSPQAGIRYSAEELLNWNQFILLSSRDNEHYPKDYEYADLKDDYPFLKISSQLFITAEDEDGKPIQGGKRIPLTLFEVPYKLWLCPTTHEDNWNLQFSFGKSNVAKNYMNGKSTNSYLFELWSNNLFYKNISNGKSFLPRFKIYGYAQASKQSGDRANEKNIVLLPESKDRKVIAELVKKTTVDGKTDDLRNIKSKGVFNFSALGTSTYLEYDYDDDPIKSWKQEIKLGRDNYVEITRRAVDGNTCLKLLISTIAERRIENGVSYLKKRYYLKYQTKSISFEHINNCHTPFKKITALQTGAFFTPCIKDSVNLVLKEGSKCDEDGNPEKDLLKFKYQGIDWNDKEHYFEMDIALILAYRYKIESGEYKYQHGEKIITYKKGETVPFQHTGDLIEDKKAGYTLKIQPFNQKFAEDSLRSIIRRKIEKAPYYYVYITDKLAFAPSNNDNGDRNGKTTVKTVNTELQTEGILFYTIYNDEFDTEYPLLPRLFFAKAYIPQLESIEPIPKLHNVTYSASYVKNGFEGDDTSKIFLKTLRPDILNQDFNFNKNPIASEDLYFSELVKNQRSIKGDFTSKGSLVDPDINIEGLSMLKQGVVLKEKFKELKKTKFNPKDIIGSKAKIIGGISFSDILELLDLDDLPVMEVINDVNKSYSRLSNQLKGYDEIFEALKSWEIDFEVLRDKIEELPNKIAAEERELIEAIRREAGNEINKLKTQLLNKATKYLDLVYLKWRKNLNLGDFKVSEVIIDHTFQGLEKIYTKLKKTNEYKKLISWYDNLLGKIHQKQKDLQDVKRKADVDFARIYKIEKEVYNLFKDFFEKVSSHLSKEQLEAYKENLKFLSVYWFYNIIKNNKAIDIKPAINALLELNEKPFTSARIYHEILLESVNEAYAHSEDYWKEINKNLDDEINYFIKEIKYLIEEIGGQIQHKIDPLKAIGILNNTSDYIHSQYIRFTDIVEDYQNKWIELKEEAEAELVFNKKEIEKILIYKLKIISKEIIEEFGDDLKVYQSIYDNLRDGVLSEHAKYEITFSEIKTAFENTQNSYLKTFEYKRTELEREIIKQKAKLDSLKKKFDELKDPFESDKIKKLIEGEYEKLKNKTTANLEEYNKEVKKLNNHITLLKAPTKKEIRYNFNTKKFKNYDGGLVKFKANRNTSLTVDYRSNIHFKQQLPLVVDKQETELINRISDCGVSFLDLVTVNFKKIAFEKKASGRENLDIDISDIQFNGNFKFLTAFQENLRDLAGSNFLLDIDSKGANLGLQFPINDIVAGAISFHNLYFNVFFHLPFQPDQPLLIKIGINNPNNRFIVRVYGYPGYGYFLVTLDPRKGIVEVILLIEFSANTTFDLGVARGRAYMFAGIYFIKKNNIVELKGYIICSGSFKIASLFSASLVFNLRLKYSISGNFLEGEGILKTKYEVNEWLKYEYKVSFYKKIKLGDAKNGSNFVENSETLPTDIVPYTDEWTEEYLENYFSSYFIV